VASAHLDEDALIEKSSALAALLIDAFIAREHAAGRLALALRPVPQRRALVHAHCHQKAFGAADDVLTALRLIPDLDVEAIESSCCGMAGAFGYHRDRYDVSMRMAELALLPAVRGAGDDTLIVADGTSCRHQIADATRTGNPREPMHAIRVLARALRNGGNA
jgi:Fe-S oxidoreductase